MAQPYTYLDKISHIGEHQFSNQLEYNLKSYLDWALLGVGGWKNINRPTSGCYGGDFSTLRLVNDPSYTEGMVWQSARKDWVYETGVPTYNSYTPINISGVYVDGTLYTTGDATYGHHYDYPNGRVVFDAPISTSSSVQINYSCRDVQVYIADNAPWWDEIHYDSLRVDDANFENSSGVWNILANNRVQLPAIIVEVIPQRLQIPYQMGDTSQVVKQTVAFHIVAENRWWRNQLIDFITFHKDNAIQLFDANVLNSSGAYPLDYRGMRVNTNTYDDIVNTPQYQYKLCKINSMDLQATESPNPRLYTALVRGVFEVVIS